MDIRLRTERLVLREFEAADVDAMFAYLSDPEVSRWDIHRREYSREDCKDLIDAARSCRDHQPRRVFHLAVCLASEQALIGECILFPVDPDSGEAGIGFILNRHYWGRGYATEAVRELLRWAFSELGLRRVVAGCDGDNLASARVLEKAGMVRDDGYVARLNPAAVGTAARSYVADAGEPAPDYGERLPG